MVEANRKATEPREVLVLNQLRGIFKLAAVRCNVTISSATHRR
jgi:hypothetical protein